MSVHRATFWTQTLMSVSVSTTIYQSILIYGMTECSIDQNGINKTHSGSQLAQRQRTFRFINVCESHTLQPILINRHKYYHNSFFYITYIHTYIHTYIVNSFTANYCIKFKLQSHSPKKLIHIKTFESERYQILILYTHN